MAEGVNLVFDLDGTLIDSVPQIHATANIVFGNNGLPPISQETIREFVGDGLGVLVSRCMAHLGIDPDAASHAELMAGFVKIYEEAFDLTAIYPGVSTALTDLFQAGHRLAICTNKPLGPTHAVLQHFDLARFFPVIIGGDSLPQRKPDPAPLWAALAALGPGKALFIGDSEVDAGTARAAKVALALFSGGYRKAAAETLGARIVFDDFTALPRLIDRLAPDLQAATAGK